MMKIFESLSKSMFHQRMTRIPGADTLMLSLFGYPGGGQSWQFILMHFFFFKFGDIKKFSEADF